MGLAVGIALLAGVVLVIALAVRFLRRPASVSEEAYSHDVLEMEVVAVPREVSPSRETPKPEPVSTWTTELTAAVLDEAARLRLVDDLALVAAPWAIALLRRAREQEESPYVRAHIEARLA